ncbi:MAG: tetratricopeptide repeat protein [Nannocystales bacterium]
MRTRPPLLVVLSIGFLVGCEKSAPAPEQRATQPPAKSSGTNDASAEKLGKAAQEQSHSAATPKPKRKNRAQRDRERKTYAAELTQLDTDIAGIDGLIKNAPANRLNYERSSAAFMQRARLTGSYEDYAKAETALGIAFDYKPASGTFMLRSKLHYTLHRLPEARADFETAKPSADRSPGGVASIEAFEANLAMQAGDSKKAEQHFEASLASKRTSSNLASVAVYRWKTGEFEQAEALFREALKSYHGKPMEPPAWLHLNLGLLDLDRGRYDDALAHYREAETFLKGYWLIDEHIAEILTLQGKTEEAKTLYLDILERTNNPEFMDAMAGILFEEGRDDEAKAYVAKARKRYEEQMEKYPEAAYGHALGHYIEFGEDPAFVLELAQKNYALRPNLEAAVMLAQAQLKAGDAKAAAKALAPTLKSKFKSAELYVTAATVQTRLGQEKNVRGLLEKAREIDPSSEVHPPETVDLAAEPSSAN